MKIELKRDSFKYLYRWLDKIASYRSGHGNTIRNIIVNELKPQFNKAFKQYNLIMIKESPKKLLKYLQERYKDFLIAHNVDVILTTKISFEVGGPSFKDNGTYSYIVYPLDGKIKVANHIWDEGEYDNNGNGVEIEFRYFKDIDDWMKLDGYKPSKQKSRSKKNYRR